jgi:cobalt-zinc-cadmium efflux system outer membrane protein
MVAFLFSIGDSNSMKIIFTVFFLNFTFYASASLTPKEIERMAVEHSAELKAQELEVEILEAETAVAGRWQNPQIMGQFGSVESGGPSASTTELTITQNIPLSNKYSLRKEVAQAALKYRELHAEYFQLWVRHQALLAAWDVAMNKELLLHGVERAKRLSLIKTYMENSPRVSVKQNVELSIVKSSVLHLEKMQDLKQHELDVSLKELSFWLGREVKLAEINFTLPAFTKVLLPAAIDSKNDMDLLLSQKQLEAAKLEVAVASRERLPDLTIGAGHRIEKVSPNNEFQYAVVGFTIPLWDSGSQKLSAARSKEMREERYLEHNMQKILSKHEKQYDRVMYHLQQLKRFPNSLVAEQEKQIYNAEKGFKQGLIDVNTFLQAETQTHEVIDQVFINWMEYLIDLSQYQLLRSEEFKWLQ